MKIQSVVTLISLFAGLSAQAEVCGFVNKPDDIIVNLPGVMNLEDTTISPTSPFASNPKDLINSMVASGAKVTRINIVRSGETHTADLYFANTSNAWMHVSISTTGHKPGDIFDTFCK